MPDLRAQFGHGLTHLIVLMNGADLPLVQLHHSARALQPQQQRHRVYLGRKKPMVLVEGLRSVIQCMHQQSPDAGVLSDRHGPQHRVLHLE